MSKYIFAFFILIACSAVTAQKITVLEVESGLPVINAVLYNADKSKTAITDFDGHTDLSKFKSNERITISHLSYEIEQTTKAKILAKGAQFFMVPKAEQLQEVVMSISKWQQQRSDVPQKIETISAKDIAFNNPQTAADALQSSGKVFVQKSQLGGGSPMIRGFRNQ